MGSQSVAEPSPPNNDLTRQKLELLARLRDAAHEVHTALVDLAARLNRADTWLIYIAVALAGMTIVQALTLITVVAR